jgi:hypothetical protein
MPFNQPLYPLPRVAAAPDFWEAVDELDASVDPALESCDFDGFATIRAPSYGEGRQIHELCGASNFRNAHGGLKVVLSLERTPTSICRSLAPRSRSPFSRLRKPEIPNHIPPDENKSGCSTYRGVYLVKKTHITAFDR